MVDGKLLEKVMQVHAGTRAGSVCQTAGKLGEGRGGRRWVLVGWRSRGAAGGRVVLFGFC